MMTWHAIHESCDANDASARLKMFRRYSGTQASRKYKALGETWLKIVCKGASTIGGKSIAAWKLHKERGFRGIIEERRICAWLRERSDSDEDTEYSCWGFEF